jgi:RNA polymerase sigma-70 factor (ECF subfamily)
MTDAFASVTRDLPWLRALAIRLARGDPDEADDLVQDALEVASQRAPSDLEAKSPRGWLAVVLRNRWRMNRRSAARRSAREDAASQAPGATAEPVDELARMELLGFVIERLRAMPELDQRIVTLRFFDDLDATAIGERLGIPPATVRSRLQRALARLRADLDARCGERHTWALVLGTAMPSRTTTTTFLGALTAMSTATKLGITTAAIAAATTVWFVGRDAPQSANATTKTPTTAAPSSVAAAPRALDTPSLRKWHVRREAIRAQLPAVPAPIAPTDEATLAAEAKAALGAAFEDCVEDADRRLQGRIIVRATMIGSPDLGTIFESIDSVDLQTHDPALLECLVESSYAYTGPAPSAAVEATTTMAFLGGQPESVGDDAWRQQMFDAVVVAHVAELDDCTDDAAVVGTVRLELDFAAGPQATAVRTEGDGLPSDVVECTRAAAAQWFFPRKFDGRTMTYEVRFPVDAAE